MISPLGRNGRKYLVTSLVPVGEPGNATLTRVDFRIVLKRGQMHSKGGGGNLIGKANCHGECKSIPIGGGGGVKAPPAAYHYKKKPCCQLAMVSKCGILSIH